MAPPVRPKLFPNTPPYRPHRDTFEAVQHLDAHLTAAIAELSKERPPIMRGMQRLANLAPTIVAAIDAEADAVADELTRQQGRAKEAINSFRNFAGAIGKTADDIEAALGQLSNDPTQTSGTSA